MKRILIFTIPFVLLLSCGPSQQEIDSKNKAQMDSVAQATKDQVEAERIANEKAVEEKRRSQVNSEMLKVQLIDLKAKLEAAQAKLEDVKQFKMMRTSDEKFAQIESAKKEVEQFKMEIQEVQERLASGENISNNGLISEQVAFEKAVQDSIAAAEQATTHTK